VTAAKSRPVHFGEIADRIADRGPPGVVKKLAFLHMRSFQEASDSCFNCPKAAALLRQQATLLHSTTLSSAAATAMGSDQLNDVVRSLEGLIDNLITEQKSELEHKRWCEDEQRRSSLKRQGHSYAVDSIQQTINGLLELVSMKQTDLNENTRDITTEDTSFEDQIQIRDTDHHEYEENMKDASDAIAAMNEAIEILANFYASRKNAGASAFLQKSVKTDPASGSQVVKLLSNTRAAFESAEADLKVNEQAEAETFQEARTTHMATDNDLNHNKDTVTVEQQTAEQELDSGRTDLETNQGEIVAATSYIERLGQSCNPLIENFAKRRELRTEEKRAIKDAVKVLQEVA